MRSRYTRSAVDVRSRCGRGTLVVRSRFGCGAVEVRSRCASGTLTGAVPVRCGTLTLYQAVLYMYVRTHFMRIDHSIESFVLMCLPMT